MCEYVCKWHIIKMLVEIIDFYVCIKFQYMRIHKQTDRIYPDKLSHTHTIHDSALMKNPEEYFINWSSCSSFMLSIFSVAVKLVCVSVSSTRLFSRSLFFIHLCCCSPFQAVNRFLYISSSTTKNNYNDRKNKVRDRERKG